MVNPEVKGAVSPEEKPIIENIISLFEKLLSMNTSSKPAPVVEAAMGEDAKMEEVDVEKAVTEETGDDSAEERLENVTHLTDESLQDLKKSMELLTSHIIGKKKVQKDVRATVNKSQVDALNSIAKMLAQVVQKQDAQEAFNSEIMKAIGFTDDVVKKALPQDNVVAKDKPIQGLDSATVIKEVLTEVFKNIPALNKNPEYQHPFNQKKDVRKNLRDIAGFIHNKG